MGSEITTLSIDLALGHFYLLPEQIRAQLGSPLPPHNIVTLYGQDIYYCDAGQGPVVIFLHGLGGEASNWIANIEPISREHHIYALDQVGFGRSSKPQIEYRIQTYVEFLEAFMCELKIPRASIIGNSLGGWIAIEFAIQHRDMVDNLILVDSGGLSPTAPARALLPDLGRGSVRGTRKTLELVFYEKELVTDELARRAFEHHMRINDGYVRQRILTGILYSRQFVDEKLSQIKAPTFIIWGSNDQVTPLRQGRRFHTGIPRSTMRVLDECGHTPQIEKPGEFNEAILEYLARPLNA